MGAATSIESARRRANNFVGLMFDGGIEIVLRRSDRSVAKVIVSGALYSTAHGDHTVVAAGRSAGTTTAAGRHAAGRRESERTHSRKSKKNTIGAIDGIGSGNT